MKITTKIPRYHAYLYEIEPYCNEIEASEATRLMSDFSCGMRKLQVKGYSLSDVLSRGVDNPPSLV